MKKNIMIIIMLIFNVIIKASDANNQLATMQTTSMNIVSTGRLGINIASFSTRYILYSLWGDIKKIYKQCTQEYEQCMIQSDQKGKLLKLIMYPSWQLSRKIINSMQVSMLSRERIKSVLAQNQQLLVYNPKMTPNGIISHIISPEVVSLPLVQVEVVGATQPKIGQCTIGANDTVPLLVEPLTAVASTQKEVVQVVKLEESESTLLLSQEESNVAQAKIEYQKIVHEASERDIKGSYFAALDKMKQVNQLLVLARKENDAALERFASRPVHCEVLLKQQLKARFDETLKIVEKVNNDLIICMKVCQLLMPHSK